MLIKASPPPSSATYHHPPQPPKQLLSHRFETPLAVAMSNGGTLPQDLITDNILSRLPVKSLYRFKCVSPLWKSLISDPHFAKTHLNRTKTKNSNFPEQKIVIISRFGNLNSVDYNEVNPTSTKLEFPTVEQHDAERWVQVLGSCDGLLLVSRSDKSIFLLNPSTRECKKLPACLFVQNSIVYVERNVYGVGYNSSTDDYNVLMLSSFYENRRNMYITTVAIYSLKTNAWRRSEDFQYRYIVGNSGGVFSNGCLHYLCWNGNVSKRIIIAFDLSGEIFKEVPLPTNSSGRCEYYDYDGMVVLGGSLCLVGERGKKVCMIKEYGVRKSWTKFTMCSGFVFDVVGMLAEDEFLLFDTYGEKHLIVYNPQKFTKRDIVICGIPTNFRYGATYVESLISPFHVGGTGRQL